MDVTNLLLNEDYDQVEKLLKENKKLKFKKVLDTFVLHDIAETNYVLVAKLLLTKYDVNKMDIKYNLPIHFAIENKNYDMIKLFVENKANIFKQNSELKNSIDLAVKYDKNILKILNLSKKTSDNKDKVLHYLIKNKKITLTDELLNLFDDNDKNYVNDNKQSPLHYAILYKRNKTIIQNLITKGNINLQDKTKNTALHYAYDNDNISPFKEIVDLLIQQGANINLINKEKKLPIQLSKENRLRRQTIFKNMDHTSLLDHLETIKYYKGDNGARAINNTLKGKLEETPEIKHHIKNLDDMMINVDKTDKRYKQTFYRGLRGNDVKLFTENKIVTVKHFSSITSEKDIARQFTNIQTDPDDSCCILVFKLSPNLKLLDMRELEKMNLLVNTNEKELLLQRDITFKIKRKFFNKFYAEIINN